MDHSNEVTKRRKQVSNQIENFRDETLPSMKSVLKSLGGKIKRGIDKVLRKVRAA